MHSNSSPDIVKSSTRRVLLEQYLRLLRESRYTTTQTLSGERTADAFRQMGRHLIAAGFEDDLDRLLRFRVIEGGRSSPLPAQARSVARQLHVLDSTGEK